MYPKLDRLPQKIFSKEQCQLTWDEWEVRAFYFHFEVWITLIGEEGLFQLSCSLRLMKFAWPADKPVHDLAWHDHPPHRRAPAEWLSAMSSQIAPSDEPGLMKKGNTEHQRQRSYFNLSHLQHKEYFKSHAIMYFFFCGQNPEQLHCSTWETIQLIQLNSFLLCKEF